MLEKSTVLQECRVFHDAKFVKAHPKRCCELITRLLFLLTQGENFSGPEASEVFFGVTKLFQSPDVRSLRQALRGNRSRPFIAAGEPEAHSLPVPEGSCGCD